MRPGCAGPPSARGTTSGSSAATAGLASAAGAVGLSVLQAPLYLVVGATHLRRPATLAGYLVAVPISMLAMWEGVRLTPVTAYVLFTLIALNNVPRNLSGRWRVALAVAAVGQLVLAWVVPPTSPGFGQWLQAIL